MKHQILYYPDTILAQKSYSVDQIEFGTESLKQLVSDMFETMHSAKGIGLAASQIGILKNMFVVDLSGFPDQIKQSCGITTPKAFINPIIKSQDGKSELVEGCLSFPFISQNIVRSNHVTILAQNIDGEWFTEEASGIYAHALLHEFDHTQGITLYNRMSALKRDLTRRKIQKMTKNRTSV